MSGAPRRSLPGYLAGLIRSDLEILAAISALAAALGGRRPGEIPKILLLALIVLLIVGALKYGVGR